MDKRALVYLLALLAALSFLVGATRQGGHSLGESDYSGGPGSYRGGYYNSGGSYRFGSGPKYGDPILVALTINTDYADSLKANGGRFDAVYGLTEEDSLVAKTSGWREGNSSYYGRSDKRIYLESVDSDEDWNTHPKMLGGILWMNTGLIDDFAGAQILNAEYRDHIVTWSSAFSLGAGDTAAFVPVTAPDLQLWHQSYNNTSDEYIDVINSRVWPSRHYPPTNEIVTYQRWHDYQTVNPVGIALLNGTDLGPGVELNYTVTDYVSWLTENPGYDFTGIQMIARSGPITREVYGPSNPSIPAALVIEMRPIIRTKLNAEGPAFASALGTDLESGPYWTPDVDMSGATIHYFDPSALEGGDGSFDDPFMGLGAEIAADNHIEHITTNGGARDPSAEVQAGDVCVLLPGNHGTIIMEEYYFPEFTAFVGHPDYRPSFDSWEVWEGSNMLIKSLDVTPNLRTSGYWTGDAAQDTSVFDYDSPPFAMVFRRDEVGNGEAFNIIVQDVDFTLAPEEVSADWHAEQWNLNMVSGIQFRLATEAHVQDCDFVSVNRAVQSIGGTHNISKNISIVDCSVVNHVGEIFAAEGTRRVYVHGNYGRDAYLVNHNHIGFFQAHGTVGVDTALVDGNFYCSNSSTTRTLDEWLPWVNSFPHPDDGVDYEPFGSTGASATTSGTSNYITITNNVFHLDKEDPDNWGLQGAKLIGGTGHVVANNTFTGPGRAGTIPRGYISLSDGATNSTVINNIAGAVDTAGTGSGIVVANNNVYATDYSDAGFVSYARGTSPLTWDLSLTSDSENVDAGTATNAPDHDIDGAYRPQGYGYDIGAYESSWEVVRETVGFSSASLDSVTWSDGPSAPADSGFVGTRLSSTENQWNPNARQFGSVYECEDAGAVEYAYLRHGSTNQDMTVNNVAVWDEAGNLLAYSTSCDHVDVTSTLARYTLNTRLDLELGTNYRIGILNTDDDANVYYTQTTAFLGVAVDYQDMTDTGTCDTPVAFASDGQRHHSKGLAMWLSMDENEDGS